MFRVHCASFSSCWGRGNIRGPWSREAEGEMATRLGLCPTPWEERRVGCSRSPEPGQQVGQGTPDAQAEGQTGECMIALQLFLCFECLETPGLDRPTCVAASRLQESIGGYFPRRQSQPLDPTSLPFGTGYEVPVAEPDEGGRDWAVHVSASTPCSRLPTASSPALVMECAAMPR